MKIFLSDSPNASKKDFLADLQPLGEISLLEDLPDEIVINQYTRETWSRLSKIIPGKNKESGKWRTTWLKSIDKRGRLPGFLKFLKGRAKAAYGKFESPHPDEVTGEVHSALFLVPFDQPPFPSKEILKKENVSNVAELIFVQYCLDERGNSAQKVRPDLNLQKRQAACKHDDTKCEKKSKQKSAGGLLGSLLGAQQRANKNLEAVPSKRRADNNPINLPGRDEELSNSTTFTTSNEVIASFRSKIEKKLTLFETSSQTEVKIQISHTEETRLLVAMEEKEKVTMEVLKYIVYEQAEEIGNDMWVAAKEPSEFTDEIVIAIYKEGYAPQEIIDEMNKGEMPDEAKQQQRAMREALSKEEKKKAKMTEEINMKKAFETNQDVKRLNNVKRDRRSIEEIQRDMMNNAKRSKS